MSVEKTTSTEPADIARCSVAFESVWALSIRHADYQPSNGERNR